MKNLALALSLCAVSGAAFAGGMAEPVMAPEVVEQSAASSADDNWAGILLTILLFGAALQ